MLSIGSSRQVRVVPTLVAIAALSLSTGWWICRDSAVAREHRVMNDAEMEKMVADFYRLHPAVTPKSTGAVVATFNASGFAFDLDGNAGTVVDTAKITVGDAVKWHRVSGTHTTTSGPNSGDPNAGLLWDSPLNLTTPDFTFTFNTPGTYPFFCRPHELDGMKGVVVVKSLVGIAPGGDRRIGFLTDPHPNPSNAGVAFRFALGRAGHVTAEVFDTRGRRVALVLDRDYGPGAQDGAWDGRAQGGARATSGIYYLRLRLPDYESTREVSITR